MTYREPTADDIGKTVEVSHHPEGHPQCNWQSVMLLDVRPFGDATFQASKRVRTGKPVPSYMEEYFWQYARIKVDE